MSRLIPRPAGPVLTLALLLGLAGAILAPGAPARAQAPLPEGYRRVATWLAQPQSRPVGDFSAAAGITVGPEGLVYVADEAEGFVHVLSPEGRGLRRIGSPGAAPGQLDRPSDLDESGGRLYVVDAGNRRLQVFEAASGRLLAVWTGFDRPRGVAAQGERIYVSEPAAGTVGVYDRAGLRLETWGAGTRPPLPLVRPEGLDADAAGNVYIADPGAAAIFVVGPDRRLVARLVRGSTNPEFQAVDVAVDGYTVLAVAPRQVFAYFSIQQASNWVPGAYVYGGRGIAVGPGAGYAVTVQDQRVDFSGVLSYPTRSPFSATATAWGGVPLALGALQGPRRLAADAAGALLLDARPRLQRWDPKGLPLAQWRAESLVDLADAPAGGAYRVQPQAVSRMGADGSEIWRWTADSPETWLTAGASSRGLTVLDVAGRRLLDFPPEGPDGPGGPGSRLRVTPIEGTIVDLAAGGGVLLLADRAAGAFRMIDNSDRELRRWPFPGRVIRLAGMRDGSAWFALSTDGWVWKYDPEGRLRAAWDGAPEGTPVDLDVDPAGRVLVADGSGDRVFVYAPDPAAERPEPPAPGDRCDLQPDKTATPGELKVGEALTVTLSLAGDCPGEGIAVDAMLVLDRSSSMEGAKFDAARAAGLAFAQELDPERARVGLVAFNQEASLEQALTADPALVAAALARLRSEGTTAIGLALRLAREALTGADARPGAARAIVLLTDGLPQDPALARSEAALARAAGIDIYTIGLGGDLDLAFLGELAGASERSFGAPTEAELGQIFTRIARRLASGRLLESITVIDVLPANMALVEGSVSPAAAWDGSRLRWVFTDLPPAGFRLRYRLRPQQAGTWPTNVLATGDYRDGVGFEGRVTFPVPRVRVLGHAAAFLPIAFQSRCAERRSDIVLAIDTSTSMDEAATPGGPSKLDAARAAARAFLGYLRLPEDRAAVVAFNGEAQLVIGLTGDRAALNAALDRLPRAAGTRIDRGLAAAQAELAGPRRQPANLPIVVLLTDGQPAEGTADLARREAEGLRRGGTIVFTVGLGADADGGLLIEVAGDPERYSYAPDQGALERIYRLLAWSLPCG